MLLLMYLGSKVEYSIYCYSCTEGVQWSLLSVSTVVVGEDMMGLLVEQQTLAPKKMQIIFWEKKI